MQHPTDIIVLVNPCVCERETIAAFVFIMDAGSCQTNQIHISMSNDDLWEIAANWV